VVLGDKILKLVLKDREYFEELLVQNNDFGLE
jgi:hypothetical protein